MLVAEDLVVLQLQVVDVERRVSSALVASTGHQSTGTPRKRDGVAGW
jgi:hypothetical protein